MAWRNHPAFSVSNDDISDLGAMTAASPWIYNQVGANLTGILVVLLGLGLWGARSVPTSSAASVQPC